MTVKLFSFSKKDNSTAQPTGGTSFDCVLKDNSGILAPSLEFGASGIGNPHSYNYAYISDYGRYYFINEWTYYRGVWTASLTVDALASWKSYIGSETAYILRSSNTSIWNSSIIDNKYPMLSEQSCVYNEGASYPWNSDYFVIGTIGEGSSGMGSATYYAMSQPNASDFFEWLNGVGIDSYISDINTLFNNFADDLFKATYNPIEYIVSARWLPFSVSSGTTVSSVNVGKTSINLGVGVYKLIPSPMQKLGPYTISIPKHPQISTRGKYLSNPPFSVYVFELQPYGRIEIDGAQLADCTTLSYTIYVDPITGESLLYLSASGTGVSVEIGAYPGVVGCNVTVGQTDIINAVQNTIGNMGKIAASAASENWYGVAQAAISSVTDMRMSGTTIGSQNSFLYGTDRGARIYLYYHNVADNDVAHFGVPVCEKLTISSAGGYIIAAEGDVAAPATQTELETIRSALTSGFYYE